jgi:predicted PurR-regulated permease PerM
MPINFYELPQWLQTLITIAILIFGIGLVIVTILGIVTIIFEYRNGKKWQNSIRKWLNSLPENERAEALNMYYTLTAEDIKRISLQIINNFKEG